MSINTLPHELFSIIFKYATEPEREALVPIFPICVDDDPVVDTVPVLHLTHVCRLWRAVALGDPTLWTRVDSRHPAQMEAFIERSQNLPVSLFVRAGPESDFADVLSSLPATRLCRLDMELETIPRDIAPLTHLHAPNLECLTISSEEEGSFGGVLPYWPQLLSTKVINLKALAVHPAMSWIPSNHFPALTHLHLSFAPEQPVSLCVYDILPLLSNTPQLEFAHIAGVMYSSMHEHPSVIPPVALPRLRSLVCSGWAHVQVVKLLALVHLPDRCWVRLEDIPIDPSSDGYPQPIPQIAPLSHTTHLEVASCEDHLLLVSEGEHSGFWIESHIDDGSATWDSWIAELPAMMPLSNITSLHINIHHEHTCWPAVLRHMSQLTDFDVLVGSSAPGHDPVDMLCELLSEEPLPAPALSRLRLHLVESIGRTGAPPVYTIAEMLAHRARVGHRVHHLHILSNVPSHLAEHLDGLSRRLSPYVDVFETLTSQPASSEFKVRDVWNVAGAERYWRTDYVDRPCYNLPSMKW
ncbi:hypothetical protein OH76DRAFT_1561755 [Lentinus brumalis]|uniref:F-box domain-containing protein n=1 Tax=Lentinus brumalis TaxID=2498619 RepID=A0A371CLI4_9APHY|nr:hypothetical protein OH76DRAFT_1561755 [Polyporus brumalis]